jgi:flagellar protein FlaJ
VRLVIGLVPVFVLLSGLAYPLTIYQQRKYKIEEQMLLFITRVSVVTYSSIARKNVFDILKYAEEFDELAIEVNKIYKLIDNWKISTPEACRLIARKTPSDMFADFLDRVAIAIENAEDPNAFLEAEHELVLDEYASRYDMMLERFEVYREVYAALLSIALFPFVMFVFIPMLMDVGTYMLMLWAVVLMIMINLLMVYGAYNTLLKEQIWHKGGIPTKSKKLVLILTLIGVSAFIVLLTILLILFLDTIPILLLGSIAVIPLFVTGFYIMRLEERIKRREDVFAPFMSSLGHSTETKGLEATKALDKLRHHDFGDLTKNINDLFLRLKTRIDSELSWEYFGSETDSEMISNFAKFYVEGAKQGGNPKNIANVITKTFTRLKALRKRRYWGSSFFVFISYFIVFNTAFVGYAAYLILRLLVSLMLEVDPTTETLGRFHSVSFLNPNIDLPFIHGILIAIIIVNIIGAVVISRITSGGHKSVSMMHIAGYTWASYFGYVGAYFMFYWVLS